MIRSPVRAGRSLLVPLLAATLTFGLVAEPLAAQEAGGGVTAEETDHRPSGWRKWVFAAAGGVVFGVPALTAESLPQEIGGCNTSACFGTLATVVGATLGFLIGHELDEKAARRDAVGPTMERASRRVQLPLQPSRVIPHERGALVLGRRGMATVSPELGVREVGQSLRGITAAAVFPEMGSIVASTTSGLYSFDIAGTETTGRLVSERGGQDLEGVDAAALVLGSPDFLRRLTLSGAGVDLDVSETAREPHGGIFSDVVWAPYAGVLWSLTRTRLVGRSPSDLSEIGGVDLPGEARHLAISGDRGMIAAGRNGVYLVDLDDPSSPGLEGKISGMAFAHDVALVGTRGYIAVGDQGLMVVDIADPANVEVEGVLRNMGFVGAVASRGDQVYVLDRRDRRLHVIEDGAMTAGAP